MFKSSQRKMVKFGTPPPHLPRYKKSRRRMIPRGPFGGDGFVSTELLIPPKVSSKNMACAPTGSFIDVLELTCKTPSAGNCGSLPRVASDRETSCSESGYSLYCTEHRTIPRILGTDELSVAEDADGNDQENQYLRSLHRDVDSNQGLSSDSRARPCRRRLKRYLSTDSEVRRPLSSVVAPARTSQERDLDELNNITDSQCHDQGYASHSSDAGDKCNRPPDSLVDQHSNGHIAAVHAYPFLSSESFKNYAQCLPTENECTVGEDEILFPDLRTHGGTILSPREDIFDSDQNMLSEAVQTVESLRQRFSADEANSSEGDPLYCMSRLEDLRKMHGRNDWLDEEEQIEDPTFPASPRMPLGLYKNCLPLELTKEPPKFTTPELHWTPASIYTNPARACRSLQGEVLVIPHPTARPKCKTSHLKDLCTRGLYILVSRRKLSLQFLIASEVVPHMIAPPIIEEQEVNNAIDMLGLKFSFFNIWDAPANSCIDRGGPISEANINASNYFEAAGQHLDSCSTPAYQAVGRRQIILDPPRNNDKKMETQALETVTASQTLQNMHSMGPPCIKIPLSRSRMDSPALAQAPPSRLGPEEQSNLMTLTRMNSVLNRTSPVRRRQPSLPFKPPFLGIAR